MAKKYLLSLLLFSMIPLTSFSEEKSSEFKEIRKKFGWGYFNKDDECPIKIDLRNKSVFYSESSPDGFNSQNPIAPEPIFSIAILKEEEVIADPECTSAYSFVLSSRRGDEKSKTLYETIFCLTKKGMYSPVESKQAFLNGTLNLCPRREKSAFPGEVWKYSIQIKK